MALTTFCSSKAVYLSFSSIALFLSWDSFIPCAKSTSWCSEVGMVSRYGLIVLTWFPIFAVVLLCDVTRSRYQYRGKGMVTSLKPDRTDLLKSSQSSRAYP